MGIVIEDVSSDTISCRGTGNIDYVAFEDLFENLGRRLGSLSDVGVRCDIRGCSSTLDFGEELRIIDYIKNHERLFTGSNWAFIVDSPELADLGQLGCVLVSVTSLRFGIEVFQSPESADKWLSAQRATTSVSST